MELDIKNMNLQIEEHKAWIRFCETLKEFGINVNLLEMKKLIKEIEYWGICFFYLRDYQLRTNLITFEQINKGFFQD